MINLMYIVLTAMLALNVSSDVLNGFSLVQEGLAKTNVNMTARNEVQYTYLKGLYEQNPTKAGPWFKTGTDLHGRTNSLYNEIDSLKTEIAHKADGPKGDFNNIVNQDDLEASASIMLNPASRRGMRLRQEIMAYRDYVAGLITDTEKRKAIVAMLSLEGKKVPGTVGMVNWEDRTFENMPAVAAITLLTKLQTDLRQAESEAMTNLINNVDVGDIRVNSLDAYVIPESNMVMRGGKYSARIVLAAIDTTQRPTIYVNGARLGGNGLFELTASGSGEHKYSGYIEVPHPDGSTERRPFSSSYTVIEPMATISPTMMNVLYAGIDNPISISVPGVTNTGVTATMTNGTLTRRGDAWVAHPGKVGEKAVVTVIADMNGKKTEVSRTEFRVRKLPDPTPFIAYKDGEGNTVHYRGGGRGISKALLMQAPGIEAAIDDDLLNISFKVLSFETVTFDSMGNALPEVSDGDKFSSRQKSQLQRLKRGNRIYVTRVKAVGPDGITRELAPLEIMIN